MEIIHDQLAKQQLMDALAESLIKLMKATCTKLNVHFRFPYQLGSIESFVMEIIHDQLAKRQLMDASAKSLIKLMTATCGYSEVRQLASQKLELWLQNPKVLCSRNDYI